jgi:hypothetical protein
VKEISIDEAVELINTEVAKVINLTRAGLWEAALKIMNIAQKRLRPSVITGNLRASGYVRDEAHMERPMPEKLATEKQLDVPDEPLGIGVELGFTALYAIYVHENMEGRSPKFLEGVLLENRDKIIQIVKERSGAA